MSMTDIQPGPNSASGRIKVADCDYDLETGDIEFNFRGGLDPIKVNIDQFNSKVNRQANLRGIMETIRDSYAGSKGDAVKARETAQSRLDTLLTGDWGKARDGTGEGQGALWVEAVARLRSWDMPTARTKLFSDAVSDEQRKVIKASPQVQKIVAEIRLERAKAAVEATANVAGSGDSILDSLM